MISPAPAQHRKWISAWLMTWFIYFSGVISRLSFICDSLQIMAVHAKAQTGWSNQSIALKMWLQINGESNAEDLINAWIHK